MLSKTISNILCILLIFTMSFSAFAETGSPLFDQINNAQTQSVSDPSDNATGTLKEDGLLSSLIDGEYRVFGSQAVRSSIKRIRFLDNLESMGPNAWDVSANGDGSVMAEINNDVLKIAGNGKIKAPASCAYLFGLYRNLKSIAGTEYFDTANVTDMTGMFSGCSSLSTIDLNTWDVSNVRTMTSMFEGCSDLKNVNAANWNMASLVDSTGIFNACTQLGIETIDGLNTEKYDDMEAEAAKTYPPLQRGSRGGAVKDLQKQLNKAGYNLGKADGIFGTQTAAAVHAYKLAHNIYDSGKHDPNECVASALMQMALFSSDNDTQEEETETVPVESIRESGITLTIPNECEIENDELPDNRMRLSILLSNTSTAHSIIAYTLAIYANSVWNTDQQQTPVYHTVMQTIAPESTERSNAIIIKTDGRISNLYIGIQSVTYDDGTAITADNISYRSFNAIAWAKDDD